LKEYNEENNAARIAISLALSVSQAASGTARNAANALLDMLTCSTDKLKNPI